MQMRRECLHLLLVWAVLTAVVYCALLLPPSTGVSPRVARTAAALPTPACSGMPRTAVVLQAHNLTDCLLAQVKKMMADLRGTGADFHLLFNDNDGTGAGSPALARTGVLLSAWSRTQVADSYDERGRAAFDNAYEKLALLRWSAEHPEYAEVWLVEDDVFFTGSWALLVQAHCARRDHMLGTALDEEATHKLVPWLWKRCSFCTAQTRDAVALTFLPVARFSRRLLAAVDARLRTTHDAARFEIFFPTLCHREPWCAVGMIASDLVGVSRYRPCIVSLGEPDRLYHPVKLDERCRPRVNCKQAAPRNPVLRPGGTASDGRPAELRP